MSSVGAYLRGVRAERGVSLEEISRSTRVLIHYLAALEADDLGALPAPVFAKGFIRAYCQALGIAPDEALALFEGPKREQPVPCASTAAEPAPAPRTLAAETARRREAEVRRSHGAVLVGFVMLVVLGLALFAMTLWLQPSRGGDAGAGPEPSAAAPPHPEPSAVARAASEPMRPAPSEAAPSTPPAPATSAVRTTVSPPAPEQAPVPAPGPAPVVAGVGSPYRLVARTSELTWMRVRTGDGRTSEENIPAGETREWVSNRPFELTIGNAGGVALELNGRPVPPLGPRGAVIQRFVLPSEAR